MPATDATKIQKYGLEERILDLSLGRTSSQVAELVTAELQAKGIQDQISQPTVSRFLRKVRASRAEETRNIVQEHIKAHVPKDLEAIEEIELWLLDRFRGRVDLSEDIGRIKQIGPIDEEGKEKLTRLAKEIAAVIDGDHKTKAEFGMKAARLIELKLKYAGILENPENPRTAGDDPVDLDEFRSEVGKEAACASVSTH